MYTRQLIKYRNKIYMLCNKVGHSEILYEHKIDFTPHTPKNRKITSTRGKQLL